MPEKKYRLRLKRIDRVAFVDKGDNPTADVVVWKRAPEGEATKALSFAEARAKMEAERASWQHTDVLMSVIRSIAEDEEMEAAAKTALMEQSIDEFATEMKAAMSPMMKQDKGPLGRLISALGKALNWSPEQVDQITQEVGDDMPETKTFDINTLPEEAKAAFAELTKRVETAEAKVAELTPVEKQDEPQVPEAVQKQMDELAKQAQEARAEVAKIRLEQRTAEFVTKAAGYKHLPIKSAEFGPILRKIEDGEKLTKEESAEIDRVLAAANEVARTGKLFEEIGHGGDGENTVKAKVAAEVAKLREQDPTLSEQAARGRVYQNNPELRREAEAEATR